MSLFGALTSGVSGLVSQSSAMAAIADNITNVNTVGYKKTGVEFQTLVTKQTSSSAYSPGGVQSRPRASTDVQGLLQATTSQTDIAISGEGFFVVNEARQPGAGDEYMFTRAGSFFMDDEGFLRNTAGFYLQGWPTDPSGNVILPDGSNAGLTNTRIISSRFMETVNLSGISGTPAVTSEVEIGANLPANALVGDQHNIDIQFFDTLGNANDTSVVLTKSAANEWDISVDPPADSAVVNLYDDSGNIYQSVGQLEFSGIPDAGQSLSLSVGGTPYTYTFVATTTVAGDGQIQVNGNRTLAQVVSELREEINADVGNSPASTKLGNGTVLLIKGDTTNPIITVDPSGLTAGGVPVTSQTAPFSVQPKTATTPALTFGGDGVPSIVGVHKMSVHGFTSGAADLDDADLDGDGNLDVEQVTFGFGTIGEADGMTQFGAEFTPSFVRQNGAKFGTFSGVTISPGGEMVALFDNGERRTIYQLPVATFVNPNGLGGKSGNVWNATQSSGDPTLRAADSGPAGQIVQSSLEASTVDIGEEFTDMIVVQRAYSAATRIISTADEMLEELVRIKR
jgi:flagellar hook protein FlgE